MVAMELAVYIKMPISTLILLMPISTQATLLAQLWVDVGCGWHAVGQGQVFTLWKGLCMIIDGICGRAQAVGDDVSRQFPGHFTEIQVRTD